MAWAFLAVACGTYVAHGRQVIEVRVLGLDAMISRMRSSVVPATRSTTIPRKLGLVCGVCWALSAAASCFIALNPLLSPVRFGSPGPPPILPVLLVPAWAVTGMLYAFFWVSLPVFLLIAGAGLLTFAVPGWRWHTAWAAAGTAGVGVYLLGLYVLNPFDAHPGYWLGLSIGFATMGATMIWGLTSAEKSANRAPGSLDNRSVVASAASAPAGSVWGGRGRRCVSVACTVALVAAIGAIAVTLTRGTRPTMSLTGSGMSVSSLAFSPDGQILAVADEEGVTYLWNVASGRRMAVLPDPGRQASVDSVAFSPDGKVLAAGDGDGSTYLWSTATGKRIATLPHPGHQASVDSVAFSPDGKTLATGDGDGSTYLWNTATSKLITAMRVPGGVSAVAFSPDDRVLASEDADGATYLWDLVTGKHTATFSGGTADGVGGSVAFSPDGKTLAVADGDVYAGSARLWNVATGKLIASFSDPSGYAVSSVAFSSDGRVLASGDNYDADQPASFPARTYLWDVSGLP